MSVLAFSVTFFAGALWGALSVWFFFKVHAVVRRVSERKEMKAAKEAAERICGGTEMHVGRTAKVIERACLEAQLEVLKKLRPDVTFPISRFEILDIITEIEAKLKAMK